MADIFERVEKKYVLTKKQYNRLREVMQDHMIPDEYGKSTICNIYFDTDGYDLISHSITKPFFKEKIRLRSYGTPNNDSNVFLEIKRKIDGVVYKRRIGMKLNEFNEYIKDKSSIKNENTQIKTELDYYFDRMNLKKAMYVSYSREAFYDKYNRDFRITFDNNILARDYNLNLEKGNYGTNILRPDKYIMEIKTLGSIPLWFVKLLNECEISPCGFSKYGEAYTQLVLKANDLMSCVV